MQFKSYNEMENHTKKAILNAVIEQGHASDDVMWCAREKIHGTNFSMWYDGTEFKVARRSGFMAWDTSFYDQCTIQKRYEKCIKNMYQYLVETDRMDNAEFELAVYGEYAGVMSTGKRIQTGIEYGDQDFYVFDIKINGYFIDDMTMDILCRENGMKTAPLLAVGTFEKVMAIPNDLQSVVIDYNKNLPIEIKKGTDNVAEGFVAKPVDPAFFRNGSRVAIKCKNEKWNEKARDKKTTVVAKNISENDQAIINELIKYATENRVKNVLSKIGVPSTNEFGKVMGMTAQDAIKDYENDFDVQLKEQADEPARVSRVFNSEVGNMIRPNWVAICDGTW